MATFAYDVKIARVQRTLRWLEEDASLLSLRVRDLSPERQTVAKRFAASMIDQTRAERFVRIAIRQHQWIRERDHAVGNPPRQVHERAAFAPPSRATR